MNRRPDSIDSAAVLSRRSVVAGVAASVMSFAAAPELFAEARQAAMKEKPAKPGNKTRTSLHQEINLKLAPARVYGILLDSKQFAALTGLPAEIDAKEGGAFSLFGGMIVGRNIELVANQRIVQAWRPANWNPGVYSVVKFELRTEGSGTKVILDHTGFPEGGFDHLNAGWYAHYWEPMKKLAA